MFIIYIFKTDVRTKPAAVRVCQQLMANGLAVRATVDLTDCDKVLRVVTSYVPIKTIESTVREMGFRVEELTT